MKGSPKKSKTSFATLYLPQRRDHRADRQLSTSNAGHDPCHRRILHRRNVTASAHHFPQWQLALFSRRRRCLLKRTENAIAQCAESFINQHGAESAGLQRRGGWRDPETLPRKLPESGITGVAGPSGGTEQKPVGLVYIALAGEEGTQVVERNFPGDRKRVRQFSTQQALEMIRRALL